MTTWRKSLAALVVVAGGVAVAEVVPGEVRSVQARDGVVVREAPRVLAKKVATLPYGTRVRVTEVSSFYAKIATDDAVEGWVRGADLVAPASLTGGGAHGTVGQGNVATSDVTAAGRQFDEGTEGKYRASSAELTAAYVLVDALEARGPKPDSAEVEAFVVEGKLGWLKP